MNRGGRRSAATAIEEHAPLRGVLLGFSLVLLGAAVAMAREDAWVALVPGVLGLAYVVFLMHEKFLLAYAAARGLRGIVVTSDSKRWRERIEARLVARLPASYVVLNWSRRHVPQEPLARLAWRLHRHFVGHTRDYCPAVIVLRGLRFPRIFRMYKAFKELRKGREDALTFLEARLLEALGDATSDSESP